MNDQEDPRTLVAELDAIEARVRQYRSLAVRMTGYASQPVHEVELHDEIPVRKSSILKFFGSTTSYNSRGRVEVASLDAIERRALANALTALADREAKKAKALAERIGTTTKVN